MARARTPRPKGESTQPEILRAIRLGDNGDVYGPGEEDEFLDALKDHVEQHNETVKLKKEGKPLDVDDELRRLSVGGHIVNFAGVGELDDDELEHSDHDLRANQIARRRAMVEGAAPGDESTPPPGGFRPSRRRVEPTEGVESNEETKRLNDGIGDVDDLGNAGAEADAERPAAKRASKRSRAKK